MLGLTTILAVWGAGLSTIVALRSFWGGRTSFAVTHEEDFYQDDEQQDVDSAHVVGLLNRSDRQQTIHYIDFIWADRTPLGRVYVEDASGFEGGSTERQIPPAGVSKLWTIPDHDWQADAPPNGHPKARPYIRIAVPHRRRLYWLPYRPVGTGSRGLADRARRWLVGKKMVF